MLLPRPVIFYIDPLWRKKEAKHIPLLYPFWGMPEQTDKPLNIPERYRFDTSCYALTEEITKSDFVLVPYNYNFISEKNPVLFEKIVSFAQKNKKPLLIDGAGDIEKPIAIKDAYVLRIGPYRFQHKENEIVITPYPDDMLRHRNGELIIRPKGDIPIVGFAGWSKLTLKQRVRTELKMLPYRLLSFFDSRYGAYEKGVVFRGRALSTLSAAPETLLKANFIKRISFSGHLNTAVGDPWKLREEFVQNLIESDYALSVRGDANASTRFYEALSLGRIPLFLDTECVLPFEDEIDYKSFCVFVDFRKVKTMPGVLAEFHKKVTNEHFMEMQRKAREVFASYLRTDALTKPLMQRLLKIAENHQSK